MTPIPNPWASWIADETIMMLYNEGIKRWGGSSSDPMNGCVSAALGAAYNAELYTPDSDQEGIIQGLIFACYLLFYLATKHCYVDGNKRIAWACMTFVLLSFGLTLEATEDEAVDFCLQVASGQVKSGEEVSAWVCPRLVAITLPPAPPDDPTRPVK